MTGMVLASQAWLQPDSERLAPAGYKPGLQPFTFAQPVQAGIQGPAGGPSPP